MRIRTYNIPQDRVTDHRVAGLSGGSEVLYNGYPGAFVLDRIVDELEVEEEKESLLTIVAELEAEAAAEALLQKASS
jgi:protein subunit release factor A